VPRKEYSFEIRERAEELYVIDGLTFDEVAAGTGIAAITLKKWAAAEDWRGKREEYRLSFKDIKSNIVKLRKKLFEKAVDSLDPQDVFAAVRLEGVELKRDKKEEKAPDIDRPKIFLEDMEFVAKTLQEIDPEGLKIFARNFEAITGKFKDAQKT